MDTDIYTVKLILTTGLDGLFCSHSRECAVNVNFISAACAILLFSSEVLQQATTCASAASFLPTLWFSTELGDFWFSIKYKILLEKVRGGGSL